MGISSPRLLRLRSEMVWPSRRYSVTLGTMMVAAAAWRGAGACCSCCNGCGCPGLLSTLPSADGSSGRSNLLRSHQASGSDSIKSRASERLDPTAGMRRFAASTTHL